MMFDMNSSLLFFCIAHQTSLFASFPPLFFTLVLGVLKKVKWRQGALSGVKRRTVG